jgi:hypothetical protein
VARISLPSAGDGTLVDYGFNATAGASIAAATSVWSIPSRRRTSCSAPGLVAWPRRRGRAAPA